MPLTLTRFETGKLLSGEATAVSRVYDAAMGCPHAPGSVLILTSAYAAPLPGVALGPETPVARATVTNVERAGIGERRQDMRKAILEGFEDARAWHVHLKQQYGELPDMTSVYRLTLRLDEVYSKR